MTVSEKVIVKTVRVGGAGGEAEILIQKRNWFPGRGGAIMSRQIVATALRADYGAIPGTGDRLFFKHLIMKKLDDYFLRTGVYTFSHIARPLGSTGVSQGEQEAYLYEWVFGSEGFTWVIPGESGVMEQIVLDEWNEFIMAFHKAGIQVSHDIADSDNAYVSQNIVHQLCNLNGYELNCFWKRIDFGSCSLPINYDRLMDFFRSNSDALTEVLRKERYELLLLAQKFLVNGKTMIKEELERLDNLTKSYRWSSILHHQPKIVIQ